MVVRERSISRTRHRKSHPVQYEHESPITTESRPTTSLSDVELSLFPDGYRSLTSISLQSFFLGGVFCSSIVFAILLRVFSDSLGSRYETIWHVPAFLSLLSFFHISEFLITAKYNTLSTKRSSFLLFSNGSAYAIAHSCAVVEMSVTSLFLPRWKEAVTFDPWGKLLAVVLIVGGQAFRSLAMIKAGTNFSHVPKVKKVEGHSLVTRGVYAWSRHPSYCGFFWWAIGTQILVGNVFCGMAYSIVLWMFFRDRIIKEERSLVEFFGKDYINYKQKTGTGIIGIS